MSIDIRTTQPSLVDRLRALLPKRIQGSGVGVFYLGGNAFYGQAWDFTRLANSVYGNPTGYRCIEAIAWNFARPPWAIYPKGTDWPNVGEAKTVEKHDLLTLLRNPNPDTSATMWQYLTARDLELTGKSFWLKGRGDVSTAIGKLPPPKTLDRLPAQRVTVVGNADHKLLGFVYTDFRGRQVPILPENMLYLRYPHPERVYDGLAPALVAGLAAETDTSATRFNKRLLDNDSALPGYLVLEGLSPDDFASWKKEWETGEPGKTRFVSGGQGRYFKVGQTNQELTYQELRQDSQEDIRSAFGVPPAIAYDLTHETYANAEREMSIFMQQNILPKWGLVADESTLQLSPEYTDTPVVGFNVTGIDELQDSRDAVIERGVKLVLIKAKTLNEFRTKDLGLPEVPWGNEPQAPFQQMSAIPMGPGATSPEGEPPPGMEKTGTPPPKTAPPPAPGGKPATKPAPKPAKPAQPKAETVVLPAVSLVEPTSNGTLG